MLTASAIIYTAAIPEYPHSHMTFRRLILLISIGLIVCATATAARFEAVMSGLNEVPPNASPATGFTAVTIVGDLMSVHVDWSGLIGGNPAAAHIHCCIAPGNNVRVAVGFPNFPPTTSGTYDQDFDLTDANIYTMGFLNNFGGGTAAGAEAALKAGLGARLAYSNIHNAQFGGGEIRGLLTEIPEPLTVMLLPAGIGLLAFVRRKLWR